MVQTIVSLGDYEDRVLNIVKGKFGLKSKSDTVNFLIRKYDEDMLESELKPEFIEKVKDIEKNGKFKNYKTMTSLRNDIENA
jgi:hypothetical protein